MQTCTDSVSVAQSSIFKIKVIKYQSPKQCMCRGYQTKKLVEISQLNIRHSSDFLVTCSFLPAQPPSSHSVIFHSPQFPTPQHQSRRPHQGNSVHLFLITHSQYIYPSLADTLWQIFHSCKALQHFLPDPACP